MKHITTKVKYMNTMKDKFNINSIINIFRMKNYKFLTIALLSCIISSLNTSCYLETRREISPRHDIIFVDSLLEPDKAYYHTYIVMHGLDTIYRFEYTQLLASGCPIKLHFIPTTNFNTYNDDYKSHFLTFNATVLGLNLDVLGEIYYPRDKVSIEIPARYTDEQFYYLDVKLPVLSKTSSFLGLEVPEKSRIIEITNVPDKIYYHYDWHSSVHYDYMHYNADSAILTFNVENPMLSDTITPIDSAYIVFHDSPIAVGYNEFPLQVKDTISILDDVTFHYTIGGLLKGQKCGEATHTIRIHKSEVISEQDETHRHQGEIYEYDE